MSTKAFFTFYEALPRQGPGLSEDVAWAAWVAELPATARMADAGCGVGGDIPALLAVAPEGHVTAVDTHAPFTDQAAARFADDPRVTARAGDMGTLMGPLDFIWCAGALYFTGIVNGLSAWRDILAPGGTVAFSQPCLFTDAPSKDVRAFWSEDGLPTNEAGIRAEINAAGYDLLATRKLSDAAWEAYYTPMEAHIAALTPQADPDMAEVLEGARREIALWRKTRAETGYLLCVVRPG